MTAHPKFGYFTSHPIPSLRSTVRVTITAPDGAILRAMDVTLPEDSEHQAANAVADMISDYAGDDDCRDVTLALALRTSLIDESNANNSPFIDETDFPEHERYEESGR